MFIMLACLSFSLWLKSHVWPLTVYPNSLTRVLPIPLTSIRLAGPEDTLAQLELEKKAMDRITKAGIVCPVPFRVQRPSWASYLGAPYGYKPTEASDTVLRVDKANGGDGVNFARVVTFLPGKLLAECAGKPPAVPCSGALRRVGATVACVGAALYGDNSHCLSKTMVHSEDSSNGNENSSIATVYAPWNPAAARRNLAWDLGNALACESDLKFVENPAKRELVVKWLRRFSRATQQDKTETAAGAVDHNTDDTADGAFTGLLLGLPEQVIHGDLNDYNVLLTDDAALCIDTVDETTTTTTTGTTEIANYPDVIAVARRFCCGVSVLDFGDMVWSKRIYDLAIAVAYAAQRRVTANDALSAALNVVQGYATAQRALYQSANGCDKSSASPDGNEGLMIGGDKISKAEALALPVCVAARLCQSVLTSAATLADIRATATSVLDSRGGGNTDEEVMNAKKVEVESRAAYVAVSAAPGWALLQQWDELYDSGQLDGLVQVLVEW